MNANRFALDQLRFKRLNGKSVQCRRAIEQHWVTFGHFIENVPDLRRLAFDHFLRAAYCVDVPEIFQPPNDEWFEKHKRHLLWQATLMQLQLGTNDDHRAARVIDTFAEKILSEPAALALEHVAKGFEGTIARACDGATMSAVVKQSVYRFLQHTLFIANNNVRRFEQKEVFEAIVAVNNPAVQIVQIGGRKTSPFQRNQRAQIGWNNRQHIQDHPFRPCMRILKALNEL